MLCKQYYTLIHNFVTYQFDKSVIQVGNRHKKAKYLQKDMDKKSICEIYSSLRTEILGTEDGSTEAA